jgi:hypothetical protein
MGQLAIAEEGQSALSEPVRGLVHELESRQSTMVHRDGQGQIVSLEVPREYADDVHLDLISLISTVQDIKIYMKQHDSKLSLAGIASLRRLPNLSTLRIWCGGQLASGIVRGIAHVEGLTRLEVVACEVPNDELFAITNMSKLTELRIADSASFGDKDLALLKRLPELRSVEFQRTAVSSEGLALILGDVQSITNAVAKHPRK